MRNRRAVPGLTGLLITALLVLLPPPAQAALSWETVSYRSMFKDPPNYNVSVEIQAWVQKAGLERRMKLHNQSTYDYYVTVYRRQEGKATVKVGGVLVPAGRVRHVRWTTGRCRGEVAAGVTYRDSRYKYDTSWPKPMKSAAKRC